MFAKCEVLDLVENNTNSKAVTDIILREMFDLDACTVSDGENVEVERTKDIIRRRVDRLIATMKDKKMKLRVKRVSDMYLTVTYLNRIYYLVDVLLQCIINNYKIRYNKSTFLYIVYVSNPRNCNIALSNL